MRSHAEFKAIEQNDLLVLRSPSCRIGVETKPFERVVQKCLSDRDPGPSAAHPIIESDNLLLRF